MKNLLIYAIENSRLYRFLYIKMWNLWNIFDNSRCSLLCLKRSRYNIVSILSRNRIHCMKLIYILSIIILNSIYDTRVKKHIFFFSIKFFRVRFYQRIDQMFFVFNQLKKNQRQKLTRWIRVFDQIKKKSTIKIVNSRV